MRVQRQLTETRLVTTAIVFAIGCHHAPPAATGNATIVPVEDAAALIADSAATPPRDSAIPDAAGAPLDAISPPVALDAAVSGPDIAPAIGAAADMLVAGLSVQRFRDNIKALSALGDRTQGSPSFDSGARWLEGQLTALGYTVEHDSYTFNGQPRISLLATKIGSKFPDRMYLVMAHLDGRGGGGGADDDGSGVSLVLEVARAFAPANVTTDVSLRFAFWNNEETGLDGSRAYVRAHVMRQGMEDPPGSGRYPEPRWLGAIMHDMMLFDHGMPPGPMQSPGADIDIDYQMSARASADGKMLAQMLSDGARHFARDYPTKVGPTMAGTDSVSFQDFTAAVSVREARRVEEILRGSNPHHHDPSDVYASYSDADFRLGFNALQLTLGTVAQLAGTRVGP
jgi:hypothetical protein